MDAMNTRRSFLSQMLRAGVAAMVLPAATTYSRIWVPERRIVAGLDVGTDVTVTYWVQTNRSWYCTDEAYRREMYAINRRAFDFHDEFSEFMKL